MPLPFWKLIVAVGGLLSIFLGSAVAEERAATEVSREAFSIFKQAECQPDNCGGVIFGEVPRGHRWEIRSVSCYVGIGNVDGKVLYWYLTAFRSSKQFGHIELRPTRLGTSTTIVTYNATEQGLIVAPAGATVLVAMTRDASTAGGIPHQMCTIGGNDITLK